MLVCLHEEHVVAIAHGYAKVTGKPLLGIVHSNVGLMHASMAMYNAWCDRMPVILIGATGPVDAAKRRPWIDWLHTARDQASLVRGFVKWDDQPASVAAAFESLMRARQIAETAPKGPVYVCLDVSTQEEKLASDAAPAGPVAVSAAAAPPTLRRSSSNAPPQCLAGAQRPLILMGRVSRDVASWNARVELAERLNAKVLTDLKVGAAFPTDHPLHAAPPSIFLDPAAAKTLARSGRGDEPRLGRSRGYVEAGVGNRRGGIARHPGVERPDRAQRGEHGSPGPAADRPVPLLRARAGRGRPASGSAIDVCQASPATTARAASAGAAAAAPVARASGPITIAMVAQALQHALHGNDVCLLHLPLGWAGDMWHFRHPLDFVGSDGGGGIGAGPGLTVGGAIALKGTSRLPVSILGDGDYLMGVNALWTAAHGRRSAARSGLQQPLVLQR